jgi:TonB family protein
MALHLLLFTSDAETALILGKLLAEFDIEVEFCSEILTSVEKVTREKFDAIVVDWDDGAEATFLLKTVRELKSTRECVVLALASEAGAGPCAVQVGANGVLHKPVVPDQIRETFGTIRDLIASRQSAAASSQLSPANIPRETSPATDTEAQQEVWNPEAEDTSRKPVDDAKFRFLAKETRELPSLPPLEKVPEPLRPEAYTGTVFTSSPYVSEPRAPKPSTKRAHKSGGKVIVLAVLVFVAAAAYVFSPGSAYLERLTALGKTVFSKKDPPPKIVVEATPPALAVNPVQVPVSRPTEKAPDAGVDDSADGEEAANIQVVPVVEPPDRGAPTLPSLPPPTSETASPTGEPAPAVPAQPSTAVQPAVMPQATPVAVRPSTLNTTEQTNVQVPQSLRLSNPINPMQTASTPASQQPFPSALTPLVLPEETANALLVKKLQPTYPDQALRAGIQGMVVLQAWIGKDGSVRDVKLVRGAFVLARAAVEAVKQWSYKPYYVNGQAVEAQTLITMNFRLPSPGPNSGTPSIEIVSSRGLDSAKP